jgi:hypothetical protein
MQSDALVTPLMQDFSETCCSFRAFSQIGQNSMKRHCDSAALQCFLFEFHFIRVAIEAQDKPAATLTCLLNVSSSLILVVMQSLATRL